MKSATAIRWARKRPAATLLLMALCTRALIPVGFMPGSGGLVICPGYTAARGSAASAPMSHNMSAAGMAGMEMVHSTGRSSHGGGSLEHEGSSFCPFAAAATTMATGRTAVLVTVAYTVSSRIDLPSQPFVPRGTIVPTRLPRGPPLAII